MYVNVFMSMPSTATATTAAAVAAAAAAAAFGFCLTGLLFWNKSGLRHGPEVYCCSK